MDATSDVVDNFRELFKYFKRKRPLPDFSDVLDVRRLSEEKNFSALKRFPVVAPDVERVAGLRSVESWEAFTFPNHPGFLFILNPFLPSYDRVWTERCLRDYTRKPNHCNLDAHKTQTATDDVWQTCVRNESERANLLNRLRWVTLGFHHNWDTKVYSLDESSPFPIDLSELTRYVASVVGFPSYSPEAAIVNFYPLGSTLSGHTDHSELDHQSPIFSFSFGCSAIFLLGGASKQMKPIPIYIRSGDVVVMFGPGRLNYHGVPRILADSWLPDASCCHRPLELQSVGPRLSDVSSSSSDCASPFVKVDAMSLVKNADPHERPSDCASLVCSDDDLGGKRQIHSSAGNGLHVQVGGGGGGHLERDFCDDSRVTDELLTDYLKTARININVRQVFAASASSSTSASISSPSFSSLPLSHGSQCIA